MAAAADRGEDPREARRNWRPAFSQRMVPLGLDNFAGPRPRKGVMVQETSKSSGSQLVEEILASNGEWERARALRRVKLGDCLARQEDGEWVPALSLPGTLSEQGFGRLCKLSRSPLRYGKELPIARFGGKDEGELVLTKSLMKELRALTPTSQIRSAHALDS